VGTEALQELDRAQEGKTNNLLTREIGTAEEERLIKLIPKKLMQDLEKKGLVSDFVSKIDKRL